MSANHDTFTNLEAAQRVPSVDVSAADEAENDRQMRRRERRLEMNRLTARNRRRRQQDLVQELSKTVDALKAKNKMLREDNDAMRAKIEFRDEKGGGAAEVPRPAAVGNAASERTATVDNRAPKPPALPVAVQLASPPARAVAIQNEIEAMLAKHRAGMRDRPRAALPANSLGAAPTRLMLPPSTAQLVSRNRWVKIVPFADISVLLSISISCIVLFGNRLLEVTILNLTA